MSKISVLIADDEAPSRRRMKQMLSEMPDVEIVGECEDGREAVSFIRAHAPDLVLLDIEMPGVSGLDVIAELGLQKTPAVIYVTAHDEFALRAFEVRALDYLLKPFDRERLRKAVEHARSQIEDSRVVEFTRRLRPMLENVLVEGDYPNRLEVKSRGSTVFIPVDEIDWVNAADNYLELHAGRETYLMRETLGQLEESLDPSRFVRVHRSHLVNVDRVKEMKPVFNKDQVLTLRDGTQVTVSRTYYDKLLAALRTSRRRV